VPALISDLSSESDESDGFTSPPLESSFNPNTASYYPPPHSNPIIAQSHPLIPYAPYSNDGSQAYFTGPLNALSFLPHPSSPLDESQKVRRRKQRGRDMSRSRDGRQASSDPRKSTDGSYKPLSICKALANCSLEGPDDGCLGGF